MPNPSHNHGDASIEITETTIVLDSAPVEGARSDMSKAVEMMVVGMGFVILFLVIMILLMKVSEKAVAAINAKFPEAIEEPKKPAARKTDNADIAAVIAIAKAQN